MMNLIEHNNWKEFLFTEIFDIQKGFYNKKPPCFEEGNIPFIGASDSNNGITGFTDYGTIKANSKIGYGKNEPIDRKIFKGNAICVTNNGSVGYAYYQVSDFTCTHDVNPLYLLNHELNRYIAMFLIACIEKQRVCFAYARKWRPKRMVNSRIMLPATAEGTPDWQFMEAYMKQQEQAILKPTIERLCKQLITNELMGGGKLSNLTWKEFYFTDIFTEIQRGKRIKKADHKLGNTPYVSATANSNGIDGFLGNESGVRRFENCLTLANSGSVGSAFFHSYEFVASDHITKLKREGLDKYAYLFMIPIINRLSEKYGFNREINDERIKREKIILPANKDGQPDFAFMSSFMQQVEQDILGTTLRYFADKQQITPPHANDQIKWDTFYIRDIFTIENCKCSKVSGIKEGNTPYIGATNNNNGVMKFIERKEELITKGNCIVFICDGEGSIGLSIYKHEDFVGTTTVKAGRGPQLNRYIGMFITTVADTVRGKYNFGYKRNEKNLKKETLTLPVTPEGTPDWQYMESYMRHIESQQIVTYLQHYTKYIAD